MICHETESGTARLAITHHVFTAANRRVGAGSPRSALAVDRRCSSPSRSATTAATCRYGIGFRDEGQTVAFLAQRLLNGETPLKDVVLSYNVLWFYPVVGALQDFRRQLRAAARLLPRAFDRHRGARLFARGEDDAPAVARVPRGARAGAHSRLAVQELHPAAGRREHALPAARRAHAGGFARGALEDADRRRGARAELSHPHRYRDPLQRRVARLAGAARDAWQRAVRRARGGEFRRRGVARRDRGADPLAVRDRCAAARLRLGICGAVSREGAHVHRAGRAAAEAAQHLRRRSSR